MKEYIVTQTNKNYAKYLVFGTSAESPLFLLEEIIKQLFQENGTVVLFDQLLQTGNTDNRFLAITISNGSFDLSSAKHIDRKTIDDEDRGKIAKFLRTNAKILKYSILSLQQKEAIIGGAAI